MRNYLKQQYLIPILAFLTLLVACEPGGKKPELPETAEKEQVDTLITADSKEQDSAEEASEDLRATLSGLVPEGYSVFDTILGNLNLDDLPDLILLLQKDGAESIAGDGGNVEKRPLLIFIGQPDNTYELAKRNDNVVYCTGCGGVFGDPYSGVTIKNGYFSVEHYGGSSWRWTRIITFKYSKADNDWFLYKDGGDSFHASDPEKKESTLRTTKDFGKVRFEEFDVVEED